MLFWFISINTLSSFILKKKKYFSSYVYIPSFCITFYLKLQSYSGCFLYMFNCLYPGMCWDAQLLATRQVVGHLILKYNIGFKILTVVLVIVAIIVSIQVKTWAQLLNTFCTNAKLELELMYKVQMQCYEDAKLMKLFPEIVRSLYDQDVLAEDTILHWFRKGTNPKGRCAILIFLTFQNIESPLFLETDLINPE